MSQVKSVLEAVEIQKQHSDKQLIIVTGVTGQDGNLMMEYLLKKFSNQYLIFGTVRKHDITNIHNFDLYLQNQNVHFVFLDIKDDVNIECLIKNCTPDYFINFAAQTVVPKSWENPVDTWDQNSRSVMNILNSMKQYSPKTRFYQAGTAEEFGDFMNPPQSELTIIKPRNPYGASKIASRMMINLYRENFKLYCCQSWLYNHESILRSADFVTRKISMNAAKISHALKNKLPFEIMTIGNINTQRDWSSAQDVVDSIWKMLNQDQYNVKYNGVPQDYVVSSGSSRTIREFIDLAFEYAGVQTQWQFVGPENDPINEKLFSSDQQILVEINPKFYRPFDTGVMQGDYSKIKEDLNWQPTTTFKEIVKQMVEYDIKLLNKI